MSYANDRTSKSTSLIGCVWPFLMMAALMGFLAWWFSARSNGLNPAAQSRPVDARGSLTEEETSNIKVYQLAAPSVVYVTTRSEQYNLDLHEIRTGSGSGFIWDGDGHVVTNYHVVNGAETARVTLADHSTYNAQNIWSYPDMDIAVLWINAPKSKLRPILIGSSHDLQVGQITFAIGNPFGLDQSMTNGIVSALGREVRSDNGATIQGAIQTSAAINPGNSGGPLLDSAGRLIGMNTSIVSPSGAFSGIGFAIPVDEINPIVKQLISKGTVIRPRLGVQLFADQLAQQLGVAQGALILKVVPNSPAAQAGLQGTKRDADGSLHLGDIIVAIGDQPIAKVADLYAALQPHNVGDTVAVGINRNGQRQEVMMTLQAME